MTMLYPKPPLRAVLPVAVCAAVLAGCATPRPPRAAGAASDLSATSKPPGSQPGLAPSVSPPPAAPVVSPTPGVPVDLRRVRIEGDYTPDELRAVGAFLGRVGGPQGYIVQIYFFRDQADTSPISPPAVKHAVVHYSEGNWLELRERAGAQWSVLNWGEYEAAANHQ